MRGEAQRKHHQLLAWQEAMHLAKLVYNLTALFPREELYGLTSQIKRAAISVPSNIAEGAARGTDREFLHFLHTARGSLSEVETQVFLARDLGFTAETSEIEQQMEKVFSLIGGLIKSLKGKMAE